jgi:ubiquinone/menaquinone biosynthesis C-methylase UbiE
MATKEHWQIDPWDQREMWLRLVGHETEDEHESRVQAEQIFGDRVGIRCLEIGAGVGRLLRQAKHYFRVCLGVDSSIPVVAASTRYLQPYQDCRVILTDGLHLPFMDDYFDFVYSFTCFQHIPELETIRENLKEAFRVLRSGGTIKVQTVQGLPESGLYDGFVFPSPEVFWKEFEAAGFIWSDMFEKDGWIWVNARKP